MERTRHEKREAEQQKAMCEADAQQAAQDQPTSEPTAGIRPLQGHSTAQAEAEAGREVGIAQEPLAEATATTGIDSAVPPRPPEPAATTNGAAPRPDAVLGLAGLGDFEA